MPLAMAPILTGCSAETLYGRTCTAMKPPTGRLLHISFLFPWPARQRRAKSAQDGATRTVSGKRQRESTELLQLELSPEVAILGTLARLSLHVAGVLPPLP